MSNLDALILSAGFGERLRPITKDFPKVLLPILGKPILFRIYEKIWALKPSKIFVNIHYHSDLVEKATNELEGVEIVKEPEILGTGGAIINVARRSKAENVLVHNGDVFTDINLKSLIDFHISMGSDITLAVSEIVPLKNLVIDGEDFKGIGEGKVGFTGIAVYKKKLLDEFEVKPIDVKKVWVKAIERGYKVKVFKPGERYWHDIGTPNGYAKAIFDLLGKMGERVFVNVKVKSLPPLSFDGFLVIEGEPDIERSCFFKNVVIIGDLRLVKGVYENCIISPSGIAHFDEISAMGGELNKYIIGFGGSDRKFWRVRKDNKSYVVCEYGENSEEMEKHLKATELLLECGLPVPQIFGVDRVKGQIFMEDFGDTTLYSYFKYPGNRDYLKYYGEAIRIIARLHALAPKQKSSRYFDDYVFDFEYFRWEQRHFINNFVKRFTQIKVSEGVEEELCQIARICSEFERVLLHRDYQSQNIFVRPNGYLGIVDFTGLRWGPKSYDIASLIFDPYMPFIKNYQEKLLKIYIEEFNSLSEVSLSISELETEMKYTRLQRHMQALGAYGFLSKVKGKVYFMKYIIDGLKLLIEDLDEFKAEWAALKLLITELLNQLLDTKSLVEYNYLL
uniref:CHK kinase-like domain-containing protein n=1 Tax=candidate division WOR-3 bacterium TaxID=2052148 RepID=A0A7V3ZWV8_UNCW3